MKHTGCRIKLEHTENNMKDWVHRSTQLTTELLLFCTKMLVVNRVVCWPLYCRRARMVEHNPPLMNVQDLLIRYTLDVMHCEQNVAKNILKTVIGLKDTVKVRRDLQRRGVSSHLWLTPHPTKNSRMLKPAAPYVLTNEEFDAFATIIESLKPPTGLVSNMAQYIRKKKFGGLKSHDYHVLMQQVMLLALRGLLQRGPRTAIMRMSRVFRKICSSVWNPSDIEALQAEVARSMALLEIHFPPLIF